MRKRGWRRHRRAGSCDARAGFGDRPRATSPGAAGCSKQPLGGANGLWTQAERRIVDQAATVTLFNPQAIELVSSRVGGVQRSPQWGLLLDQLWVR